MTFICLPVKSPARAKERLRDFMSPEDRESLARAMFEDVLLEARQVPGVDKLVVVSNDAQVLILAAAAGAVVLVERDQASHAASADWAIEQCMKRGATTVMLIPIDVPMVRATELTEMLEKARAMPGPNLVIVPSSDGTGTNAMVRTPPDVIASRFGLGSFVKHVGQAEQKGVSVEVMRPEGLVHDIDEPADVAWFLGRNPIGRAADLLRGILEKNEAKGELSCTC